MESIRPWCLSRQLWWGHRLPVYYCEPCGHVHVAASAPERCESCGGPPRQEEDVLDTWFSSALWPFATLGWPEETPPLRAFYPTDVLSTARDILFLWVARMIMMGLRFTGAVPFAEVYIHSVIQAPDGRRMSKSLGTGIDPLDEIARHGADAVRFGLLAMSSSQDVRYSAEKVRQGQALANKLFNAARFVLTKVSDLGAGIAGMDRDPTHPVDLEAVVDRDWSPGLMGGRSAPLEDRWILSRLQQIKADTAARIVDYDFSHAALGLYDFVYGELCDWYLEIVKPRLAGGAPGGSGADREALAATLLHVLRETVALAHPVIPFVTEELWAYLDGSGALLAGSRYPRADERLIDPEVEIEMERAIEAVTLVRGWRDSVNAPPGRVVPARVNAKGYESTTAILAALAHLDLSESGGAEPVASISVPCGTVEVLSDDGLDLAAAERRRVAAREKLGGEVARVEAKLANASFVERAPAEVVEGERTKLARLRAELEAL
jgi:valyl-tRNA synthetase